MIRNAVIYCRTACTSGPQDKAALEQERLCAGYAASHGLNVVNSFFDCGISGLSENRPGFDALLSFLQREQRPLVVLVVSRTRLARSLELLLTFINKLADLNASLIVVGEVGQKAA